jgi:hypothetical protein
MPGIGLLVFLIRLYLSESWAMVILPREGTWLLKNHHRIHTLCSYGMCCAVCIGQSTHKRALQLDNDSYSSGFDKQ